MMPMIEFDFPPLATPSSPWERNEENLFLIMGKKNGPAKLRRDKKKNVFKREKSFIVYGY